MLKFIGQSQRRHNPSRQQKTSLRMKAKVNDQKVLNLSTNE